MDWEVRLRFFLGGIKYVLSTKVHFIWRHAPCVPTCQVDFRLLPRLHNMTSLRSLYVPHGSLLPTTHYLLLGFPALLVNYAAAKFAIQ